MGEKASVGVGLAGVALAAWLVVVMVGHSRQEVYDLPRYGVALGVGGAAAAAAGWGLVAWRRDELVLWIVLVALTAVAGLVAVFSVGIFLLAVAASGALLLRQYISRRTRSVPAAVAVVAAALVAIGLPVAALAAAEEPVVRCHGNGVETNSSIFRSSRTGAAASQRGSAMAGGGSRREGEATMGGRHYRYVCEGERLVEFEAKDR